MTMKSQRGVTLLETALTLLIVGIMVAPMMALYNTIQEQKKIFITKQRMETIVEALSTYAETNSRIPCPSPPDAPDDPNPTDSVLGWENGVTYAMTRANTTQRPVGDCVAGGQEGIVPFISLGIPYEIIKDAWGSYFTYAVSPILTQNTDQSSAGSDTGNVHALCRTAPWISNADNKNALKARFCCLGRTAAPFAGSGTDIIVRLTTNDQPLTDPRAGYAAPTNDDWNAVGTTYQVAGEDAAANATIRTVAKNIDIPAFVLISHGPNRLGAYIDAIPLTRIPVPPANVFELENADTDNTYYAGPHNRGAAPNTHFDDIVVWYTQDAILAHNGKTSCAMP